MEDLKFNYKQYETPEERLRNYLQPFWYLVQLAKESGDMHLVKAAIMSEGNQDRIEALLKDIIPFYTTPYRINPKLTYRDLPPTNYYDRPTRLYTDDEGLVFLDDKEEALIVRTIHSQNDWFKLDDIAFHGKWDCRPSLTINNKNRGGEDIFWDNEEYIYQVGVDLINEIETEHTKELERDVLQARGALDFEDVKRDFKDMFQKSIIYNFWNG